jgi:hypothetical protein
MPKVFRGKKESSFSKLVNIVGQTKEKVSTAGAEFIDKNPKIKEYANRVSEGVSSKYEESGAKKHVDTITTKSGEKLDVISGQAMYELVGERLSLQDRYNDLLAIKLHEALERIAELEKNLLELKSTKK